MTARGYEFYLRVFNSISHSSLVRCRVEHEKIKFISTSGHVIFCLLHEHTNGDVFDDFPKISDHFPKIFQIVPKIRRTFPNIFRIFSEDCRRFSKISEEAPMMFRSYSITYKYFLRDFIIWLCLTRTGNYQIHEFDWLKRILTAV